MNEITSTSNQLIKLFISLAQKKYRQKHKLFLIEGEKLIKEALCSKIEIPMIFYTEDFKERSTLEYNTSSTQFFKIPQFLMSKIATTETPPEIIGAGNFITYPPRATINYLQLFCDQLQDPGNFGTIIRLSEAMGIDEIWVSSNSVDKYNPKVLRASAGSIFRVPIYETPDTEEYIKNLKWQHWTIAGTSPYAESIIYSVDFTKPTVIVLGKEGRGLSEKIKKLVHTNFKIPMQGHLESLNVAISTAIILAEVSRQRNYAI